MNMENAGTIDRIDTLAKIGASLIGVQIEAVRVAPSDIAGDPYVFGYCFGLFDAMAQMAGLDQYTQGMAMMSAGFSKLVHAASAGAALFQKAVEMQGDPAFRAGAAVGGADLAAWAADASAMPTGIARLGRADADDDAPANA